MLSHGSAHPLIDLNDLAVQEVNVGQWEVWTVAEWWEKRKNVTGKFATTLVLGALGRCLGIAQTALGVAYALFGRAS
ncbi:MAG TPA: hypothetical protein VG815_18395 [Chloroflexota bacterium]|nr:hypothetical protein [Chloroflexota bacterium]